MPPINRQHAIPRRVQRGCIAQTFITLALILAGVMALCISTIMVYWIVPPPSLNILVMGLDAREGEGRGTRSDSIMIVGLKGLNMNIASIPRDLFIHVPGYSNAQRINTINALGEIQQTGNGPRLLQDSIEANFGIRPARYVRLDFNGFKQMIDAVGGVTIDVPTRIYDPAYPTTNYGTMTVTFEAGRQHFNGERALIYARTRHQDDDYRRAERQQQVIIAFAQKAIIPIYWPSLIHAIIQNVDTNLSPIDVLRAIPSVMVGIFNTEQFVIDREYIRAGNGGASPHYELVNPIFSELFGN
jgi:LCP family protein required for cell wall assembly